MFPQPVIMLRVFVFLLIEGSLVQKDALSNWTRKQPSCPF